MEKTLKEKLDDAYIEMMDTWRNVKSIGFINTISLLIENTEKYDALLKEYQLSLEDEMEWLGYEFN